MNHIGIVIVEVCDANLISSLNLEALETEYPGVSVIRSECLSLCDFCRANPYAYVNGELVSAETVDDCLNAVKAKIEEELAVL